MLLSIVLLVGITACSSNPEDTLKSEIEKANKNYPQELSKGLEMTSIALEGNKVVFLITVDEQKAGIPLSLLESQKAAFKENAATSLKGNSAVDKLFEIMIDLKDSLVYRMQNKDGKSFDIEYTPEELKQLISK